MAGRQAATVGGLAVAGGLGYYLYSAGGDPKLAEKKAEHDAANLTRRARGDFPGQDKEAKKAAEEGYESVRATAQSYTNSAKAEAQKAEQKINEMSVEARKKYEEAKREAEREYNAGRQTVNAKVNEFDRKTLEATRETKSWLGSWFGGK